MPKPRNHPHHHSARERKRRLQGPGLPLLFPISARDPAERWRYYPPDWTLKPWWAGSRSLRRLTAVAGAALLVPLLSSLLGAIAKGR